MLLPSSVLAQVNINTPSSVQNFTSLGDIIQRVFNITVGVSGVIFVGLLLFGGVLYLTSLGNEDGVTRARKTMINGLIGLAIVVSAWAIGNFVLQLLGIRVSLTGAGISTQSSSVGTSSSGTSAPTGTFTTNQSSGTFGGSNQTSLSIPEGQGQVSSDGSGTDTLRDPDSN